MTEGIKPREFLLTIQLPDKTSLSLENTPDGVALVGDANLQDAARAFVEAIIKELNMYDIAPKKS